MLHVPTNEVYSPFELQLSVPNIIHRIIVLRRAELDVLCVFGVSEAQLGGLVEALDNMLEIIEVLGIFQEVG